MALLDLSVTAASTARIGAKCICAQELFTRVLQDLVDSIPVPWDTLEPISCIEEVTDRRLVLLSRYGVADRFLTLRGGVITLAVSSADRANGCAIELFLGLAFSFATSEMTFLSSQALITVAAELGIQIVIPWKPKRSMI